MNCLYKVLKNARVTYEENPCYLGGESTHEDVSVPHKVITDFHSREKDLEERIKNAEAELELAKTQLATEMKQKTIGVVNTAKSACERLTDESVKKGFDEGMKVARKRCDDLDAEIEKLKKDVIDKCDKHLEVIEDNILELAFAMARKIIDIELEKNDEAILSALNNVLTRFKDEKNLSIEVSEDVAEKLNTEKMKAIYSVKINKELSNEEIMLNSDYGMIDASIDSQFENLRNSLLEECKKL